MNSTEVKSFFEYGVESRIIKSDKLSCNIDEAFKIVRAWKKNGFTIVFTAGVFDILTLNHLLGLYHYRMLGGDKTKLVVSIDTDERVKSLKAFNTTKGGSTKPILSWDNRALMIAKQATNESNILVDLILQHGSDTCRGVCPHDDNVSIAENLQPDLVVVNSKSRDTISKLEQSTIIPSNNILIIQEEELAYDDELLGGKISNATIINRIKNGN